MELTRWFDCTKDGRPVRAGWYEWELWLVDARGALIRVNTMAQYHPILDFVLLNGRAIGITGADKWRGLVPSNAELTGRAEGEGPR